jgi:hypothetical protein
MRWNSGFRANKRAAGGEGLAGGRGQAVAEQTFPSNRGSLCRPEAGHQTRPKESSVVAAAAYPAWLDRRHVERLSQGQFLRYQWWGGSRASR